MKKKILPLYFCCLTAITVGETVFAPQTIMAQTASPSMTIQEPQLKRVEGQMGQTYEVAKFTVTTANTTKPVTLEIRGTDRAHFSVTPASIEAGSQTTEVTVSYKPTTSKQHKAILVIDSEEMPTLSKTYSLQGIAFNPAQPPSVTVNPNTFTPFTCEAKKTAEQTVRVTTSQMAEDTKVTFAQNKGFKLSTSSIFRNSSANLKVTFAPLHEGEYKDTIIISSYGLETQRIPVSGTATASTEVVTKEGVDIETLSFNNPVTILNEKFDNIEKNKPINISRWTNVALKGNRAWWGYTVEDKESSETDQVAKVTPFDSKVESGSETECSMMLITPPLDHVNSASKIMTLRVRGDYLRDNQPDYFGIYVLYQENDTLYSQELNNIDLPKTADRAGEWNEYHVNLSDINVKSGVFCIGFGFASMRGIQNSATYYIDDVSYGRTDLPTVNPSVSELAFNAQQSVNYVSEEITITTENTTEDVKLKVGGPNASKFKVSTTKLTKDGGKFTISFKSDKIGVHQAYIKLSSRGAADKYIALSANNTTVTGIESLNANDTLNATTTVYTLTGEKVLTVNNVTVAYLKTQLKPGIYVVRTANGSKKMIVE